MEQPAVINVTNISKQFYLDRATPRSLRELFISIARSEYHRSDPCFSIKKLSISIRKGETAALIGSNGSGKSSLLRIIAGIYQPTTGQVSISGKVGSVIELGAGFSPELTGKENIFLYGLMLGLTRQRIKDDYDGIVDFAELHDFIDAPVKYYSSGMLARLAFSIALSNQPDILLLDEVLAVGDESFRQKCKERLDNHKQSKRTLLFVSHDMEAIKSFCDKVFWLENGLLKMEGEPETVIEQYLGTLPESY